MPVLRSAAPADADAVTAVHLASRAAAMPWLPVVHTPAETRWWVEHVVLTQLRTWVAVSGDDVLGFVAVDDGRLEQLYLRPDRRRQGLGTLLFRQAQQAEPAGFTFAVFARNAPARAFYERLGCRVVARSDGRGNEEREPDITYAWRP
ncbi:GNAT family N-acetyltransferase [Modestobacter sp. L9-4]|uniref:GNAT family N-acetyltransferase n=1 Tax=Modestobacter sp. L9-4 TaxID=2851567 RepID=UPI001C74E088|nr:GNAT family N-acetyltransferase [Modestobacter sp. L9-4]QXG75389.1 GNAT family N-acetyltransferase [Modestobacter sp. L9-4]